MKVTAVRTVTTSFLVDILDVGMNLVVAVLSGSISMLAIFLESCAELLAKGFLLAGLHFSKKKADRSHPFGYGKELYFWTLLSALVMFTLAAGFSFYFGLQRFFHPHTVDNIVLVYTTFIIGTLTNGYSFSLSFKRLLGRRNPKRILRTFVHSPLIETKNTFILDLVGTAAAIIGLISLTSYTITGESRFDAIGAMTIGVTLAILAFLLILSVKDLLVGKSAPIEVERDIREAALEIPNVQEVLDLRTMQIGASRLLVNMEVHVRGKLTVDEAELLIDRIKEKIQKEIPTIHHIQVELETPDK